MGTIESDETDQALRVKMRAQRLDKSHWYYKIYNQNGVLISSTSISKGAKHTLGPHRIGVMAQQLGLTTAQQFIKLVKCTLSREDALRIMQNNRHPLSH